MGNALEIAVSACFKAVCPSGHEANSFETMHSQFVCTSLRLNAIPV